MTIPRSVKTIGDLAFADCTGLTSVTIPNSVTSIGISSFASCSSLKSVSIPTSVTYIGAGAFLKCSSLTSVAIPNSVTAINENTFWDCTGLTHIDIPNSVKSIGDGAFDDCIGLTSMDLPNSVASIGNSFQNCTGLRSVTIPNSLKSISGTPFYGCTALETVAFNAECCKNETSTVIFSDSPISRLTIGDKVTTIPSYAFFQCSRLTKLVSLAVEPPTCGEGVFEKVDKTSCQLLVPEESINKYKTADQWQEFMNILGFSGVDDVSVDTQNTVYEVYNLQGVRVGGGMREEEVTADVLPHGGYILVSPQNRKKLKI